ncbi:MAG: YcaO-like family protein [bacterium]|nr:YcaO-like family protein [bacterium]
MGITRVANVTGLDKIGIPVVMVCRPNSRSISVSQGKGQDLMAAKASGIMESVESYHAERIALPLKLGCLEDLRYTHDMIDVDRLPRLSDSAYTPFTQALWIEGRDLMQNRQLWLPYEMVHLNYCLPLPTGHGCFVANSNGLASGNHRLEAICHGICEVVERDAITLWHLLPDAEQQATRLDLGTIGDPICRDLLARFETAGVQVAVWDATSDTGIPCILCRILQRAEPPRTAYRPSSGMGCHPCREVALLRALTEAAQSRLTFISGARDDMPREEYDRFLTAETFALWQSRLTETPGQKSLSDLPTWHGESFERDLDWLLARLRSVGIEQVVAVDLTKPEFQIPVVRIVIPGLEGADHSAKFVSGPRARALSGTHR